MGFLNKKKKARTPFTEPVRDYTTRTIFGDLKERIKHRTLEGEKIYIDLTARTDWIDGNPVFHYYRLDRWTDRSASDLYHYGYEKVINMPGYDSLIWWNVPVYIKLIGFQQFDIHAKDENGNFLYSQDTSGTLHDEMISNATRDFMKGLFKTSLPTMDLQKIGLMALLAVGAIFGLMMLGII